MGFVITKIVFSGVDFCNDIYIYFCELENVVVDGDIDRKFKVLFV